MNQLESLDQAVQISEKMLNLAHEGEWEKVIELEAQRQKIILDNIKDDHSIDRSSDVGRKIQEILDFDKEMQQLAIKARDETRDEIIQLNKDKSAVEAYESK